MTFNRISVCNSRLQATLHQTSRATLRRSFASASTALKMPVKDSTTRFSSRVKDYVAHRPSYPAPSLDHLKTAFDLPDDAIIADIGCGTGILAAQLLTKFPLVKVIGIEPNMEMREAGDELLTSFIADGRFTSRDATAENTGLDPHSVDLVVAAQAFHWFDIPRAREECRRILKDNANAGVALLWNDRRGVEASASKEKSFPRLDNPVMSAYDLLLVRRGKDYREVNHHHTVNEEGLNTFYGPKGFELDTFENPYKLSFDQLKGRLLSSSYTPAEGEEGHEQLIAELRELFDKYQKDGQLDFIYDTRVFTGPIS